MKQGFSLLELLVVVAILMILGGTGMVVSGMFLNRRSGGEAVRVLRGALREAELNSIAAKGGLRWGVRTGGQTITVFAGDSFANRDSAWDEVWHLSRSASVDSHEIVFKKFSGYPVNGEVSFQLQWSGGERIIKVNPAGGIEE